MMMKRGKIAGKSLHNLLFHHHQNWVVATSPRHLQPPPSNDENEFSCTTTPKHQNKLHYYLDANDVIVKALEILKSATASLALSRFWKSPMVKQLRITDSPFPLNNGDEDGDQVDEAAEKFIMSHGGFILEIVRTLAWQVTDSATMVDLSLRLSVLPHDYAGCKDWLLEAMMNLNKLDESDYVTEFGDLRFDYKWDHPGLKFLAQISRW
ncbi:hypothetical protein Tco_1295413, partial [Tanacetum coccineum]